MRMVKIDNTEITILQDEDIARYIKRIYASNEMRTLSKTGKSFDNVKHDSSLLAEFLVQYAISTGDLSSLSISKISKKFLERQEDFVKLTKSQCDIKTGKKAKQILFEDIVLPEVTNTWAKRLDIKEPYKIKDLMQIAQVAGLQSNNNVFHTHSFNSAILDEVEENGLNISKELFKEELKAFAPIGNQPYKTGVLNTCELSNASFSYASIVPERVKNILSGNSGAKEGQGEDETTKEFLTRCVKSNLDENTGLSSSQKNKMLSDSEKIIDFYYGHQSASIAIIKQNEQITTKKPNAENMLVGALSAFKSKPITSRMYMKLPLEYRQKLNGVLLNKNRTEAINDLDTIINQIRGQNPEYEGIVDNILSYIFGDAFCRVSLNNFMQSFGDGYDIEEGKIDRDKFAIATYQDPAKMFSYYKSAEHKAQTKGQPHQYIKNAQHIVDGQNEI